jgi:hypothetical protein
MQGRRSRWCLGRSLFIAQKGRQLLRRILAGAAAFVLTGTALLIVVATGGKASPAHRLPAGPNLVDRVAAQSTSEPITAPKLSENPDVITAPVSTPPPAPVSVDPPKSPAPAPVKAPVKVAPPAPANNNQQGEHVDNDAVVAPPAKPAPVPPPRVTPKPAPPAVVAAPAAPAAPLNISGVWACIMRLESGGNPHAVNPSSGAGGLFQFLPSTWASLGGTGRPQDASPALQFAMAQKLQARSGWGQWVTHGACGV